MNVKKISVILLSAAMLLSAASCAGDGSEAPSPPETFEKETFTQAEGGSVTVTDGLDRDVFPADSPVGAWLAGCSAPDRNDHFDAYVLRYENREGEHTTSTYFIYYPHGGEPLAVNATLVKGQDRYQVNASFEKGEGKEGYSLCRLDVSITEWLTLGSRLSVLAGDEPLGVLTTVTETPLP